MRILAIDYGTKKIGLAISDALGITASELPILTVTESIYSDIAKLIIDNSVTHLLFGMPYNDDGSENESCSKVWKFMEEFDSYLKEKHNLELEFITQNENGSSKEARKRLKKRDDKKVDSKVAKDILLMYYLDI